MYTIKLISVHLDCVCEKCTCPNDCSPKGMYNVINNNVDDNNVIDVNSEIMCANCCDKYTGSKISSGNYHGVILHDEPNT